MNINKIAKNIIADIKVIFDRQRDEEYSIDELKKEYNYLKDYGYTEAETFQDYLENITSKNGTCEWITDDMCRKCHQKTTDTLLTVDGVENICWSCAEQMAQEAEKMNKDIEIEIQDYSYEPCHICGFCKELFPESELKQEEDFEYICNDCVNHLLSRGEQVKIKY